MFYLLSGHVIHQKMWFFFGDHFSVVHRLCTDKKKKVILVLKLKFKIYPENQGLIHL